MHPRKIILYCGALALCGFGAFQIAGSESSAVVDVRAAQSSTADQAVRCLEPIGFLGVVIPETMVEVTAPVDGWLESVSVSLGDRLARNAIIARIDDSELAEELAEARAAVQALRAEEEHAALELAEARERNVRRRRIVDKGASVLSDEEVSEAEYKERYAAQRLRAARARTAERQAYINKLGKRQNDTVIRAPFAGRVAIQYVSAGATVAKGAPIVRLVHSDGLWVRFAVPENRVSSVALGAKLAVRLTQLEITTDAVVDKIAPEVDAASRMIVAEARLTEYQGSQDTLSGQMVRVMPVDNDQHRTCVRPAAH